MSLPITVLYFAELQERAARPSESLSVAQSATARDVFVQLKTKYDWSLSESEIRFAVNHRFVPSTTALAAGDNLAFIPPVSGG